MSLSAHECLMLCRDVPGINGCPHVGFRSSIYSPGVIRLLDLGAWDPVVYGAGPTMEAATRDCIERKGQPYPTSIAADGHVFEYAYEYGMPRFTADGKMSDPRNWPADIRQRLGL